MNRIEGMISNQEYFYRISGFVIRIHFHSTYSNYPKLKLKSMIGDYLSGFLDDSTKHADYTICILDRNGVETYPGKKSFISFYKEVNDSKVISFYDISIYYFQIIIRDILQHLLAKSDGFILHSSAAAQKRIAYLFVGSSGAGKSTAMKLIRKTFIPLGDDSIIIRKINNKFLVYQTPMIEKESWIPKSSNPYELGAIFFPQKSSQFNVKDILSKESIFNKLIKQLWTDIKFKTAAIKSLLQFIESYSNFGYLYFAKDSEKMVNLLLKYEKDKNK